MKAAHSSILLSTCPGLAKPVSATFGSNWDRVQDASDYVEPIESEALRATALFVT